MTSIMWIVSLWGMEGHSVSPWEMQRAVSSTSYS